MIYFVAYYQATCLYGDLYFVNLYYRECNFEIYHDLQLYNLH